MTAPIYNGRIKVQCFVCKYVSGLLQNEAEKSEMTCSYCGVVLYKWNNKEKLWKRNNEMTEEEMNEADSRFKTFRRQQEDF